MLPLLAAVGPSAYLLLALPQSSSTATAIQIAQLAGTAVKHLQTFLCNSSLVLQPASSGHGGDFAHLAAYHRDVCNVSETSTGTPVVQTWVFSNTTVYKQHLPPTQANVDAVLSSGGKVVVLTRMPTGSLHAACERSRANGSTTVSSSSNWLDHWRDDAAAGHLKALMAWNDGWLRVARNHSATFMTIDYESMEVDNVAREDVLRSVLAFWGLPQRSRFINAHSRYVHRNSSTCVALVEAAKSALAAAAASPSGAPRGTTRRTRRQLEAKGGVSADE